MRLSLILIGLLLFSATAATAAPPPGNVYDTAPFTTATHFTTVPCGKPFACDARLSEEQYLAQANICAQKRLGFPANMMTLFSRDSGAYENCALPETYAPKSANLGADAQWPICCVVQKADNKCEFQCHFYASGAAGR